MNVLVTGGAGYIGAHVVRLLHKHGDGVVVADDLSSGSRDRIGDAPLVEVDLAAPSATAVLEDAIHEHAIDSVIHIAAKKQVGESAQRPAWYYQQNVGGLANLLTALESTGVEKLMFSSSAATYGLPDIAPGALITEDTAPKPISPYGETKLVGEWMNRAAGAAWGLRTVNLRYFNVAGSGWDDLGDPGVFNLIPIVFEQLSRGERPRIFGDDYDTPDGTCIRDYVHVVDLAQAHIDALGYLGRDDRPHDVFNVGTGRGASVIEILDMIRETTGRELNPQVVERRPGDPAQLVADVSRIERTLGWRAEHDLDEIMHSAWSAYQR
ncbi:MAG: UDP-glucose 4-epimerase GalE [Nocardioidaceae bacterium]